MRNVIKKGEQDGRPVFYLRGRVGRQPPPVDLRTFQLGVDSPPPELRPIEWEVIVDADNKVISAFPTGD